MAQDSSGPKEWIKKGRFAPTKPLGKTIQDSFLKICEKGGSAPAVADEISGVLSYKKLRLSALILAKKIQQLPGEHVAILLPASVAANLTILSVLLAGKVPVMLNWTLGQQVLTRVKALGGFEKVITSAAFLQRAKIDAGPLNEDLITLEELRSEISMWDKLCGLWRSWHSASSILKALHLDKLDPYKPAVILFTSGTEAMPKGVPLSHKNLLSNHAAIFDPMCFEKSDVFLSALPPFHSFGFSTTGLLPIMIGVRAFYAPDPLASKTIASSVEKWHCTVLMSAPLFLQALYQRAAPGQLQSLRIIISGSEKAPKELYETTKKLCPNGTFIEGYGLTECSPVVAANRLDADKGGVGKPLNSFEIAIIDRQTQKRLPDHAEGEICLFGPSIFYGYLNNQPSPFIELDKKEWLRTGDCGFIDSEGRLHITDRLKRFIKMGGEMIPLTGVERALSDYFTNKLGEGVQVAVLGKEEAGKKGQLFAVVGFAEGKKAEQLTRDQINSALIQEFGFGPLVQLTALHYLKTPLPLTGSGKTDYRSLEQEFIKGQE